MSEMRVQTRDRSDVNQVGAYKAEHTAAWVMVAVSIVLGTIGLLRGFGVIGTDTTLDTGALDVGAAGTRDIGFPAIWDSVVWLLPAVAAAFLASTLHRTDHHRMRDPDYLADDEEGFWKAEHAFAYLLALGAIAMAVLGMLVSFDSFNRGYDQPDGLPWLLGGLAAAVLANGLHNVRHHQLSDEEYVARIVERRAGVADTVRVRPTAEPEQLP